MDSALNIYRRPAVSHVTRLLAEAKLPASDLSPIHLEHFFACGPVDAPQGVVGLELYGKLALLRSLAVATASQGKGYGRALIEHAELYAQSHGVREVYLLTTTAAELFERFAYRRIDRGSSPDVIRQTEQFSALCPSSSAFMVKTLPAKSALQPTR
jgi:N-acetylglutamate synthase-like GNAT family acetyltransferase